MNTDAIRATRRVTYGGMAVNVVTALAKGIGGYVWHSQALIADAVHSVSDFITDIAVVLGVKYWEAPADEEHPYGHGKIQALVTLFIAMMLLFVAWELASDAISSLRAGKGASPTVVAFVIALVSVVAKEALFRWTRKVAREIRSPALEANAWHHRSDALSSIPVAIAIALAYFFPQLWWADAVGALIVGLFIVHVSWEIAHPALQELTDACIDDKANEVAKVAARVPGVIEVHNCRARRYGAAFQADLHIHVDDRLSIVEAHDLGHRVMDEILAGELDVNEAIIHVEPHEHRGEEE